MPRTSWCPDTIEPGRKTGLILSKSPTRGGRDLSGSRRLQRTAESPVLRISVLRRQNGATWLSPAPSFKLFTRQNTETRARCAKRMGGGTDSPALLETKWRSSRNSFSSTKESPRIGEESRRLLISTDIGSTRICDERVQASSREESTWINMEFLRGSIHLPLDFTSNGIKILWFIIIRIHPTQCHIQNILTDCRL